LSETKQQKEFMCDDCGLEFWRDEKYFGDMDDIQCYCCMDSTHYVDLSDIRKDNFQETDEGFWVEDVECKYCEKKLSLEFTFRDNAVTMGDMEKTNIQFGDAD
tara:strand:+ start:196 stop:504 length:309 start_codon:yes stop_codon:yes gene_type:complete